MLNQKYAEAFVEVLDVLNHMNIDDVTKVSKKFITFLNENASKDYIANLDYSKQLKEMDLKEETKGLLTLMYEKYWCSEEEKKELMKRISINEEKYQAELRKKYNPDNIFNKNININSKQIEENKSEEMIIVQKDSIFKKIINKIKSIFIK